MDIDFSSALGFLEWASLGLTTLALGLVASFGTNALKWISGKLGLSEVDKTKIGEGQKLFNQSLAVIVPVLIGLGYNFAFPVFQQLDSSGIWQFVVNGFTVFGPIFAAHGIYQVGKFIKK